MPQTKFGLNFILDQTLSSSVITSNAKEMSKLAVYAGKRHGGYYSKLKQFLHFCSGPMDLAIALSLLKIKK